MLRQFVLLASGDEETLFEAAKDSKRLLHYNFIGV
ncbi:hypothetical protein FPSM_00859 [Flavobacterium psychrophilum]|nr:hypothetical protein FPSM_00859 [Flavobacterium psychrophilum]